MTGGHLRGADPDSVQTAIEDGVSLSGADGFGGQLDGRLVRDVLGREPVFVETSGDDRRWAFAPRSLKDPVAVPGGHVLDRDALGGAGDPIDAAEEVLSLPDPEPGSYRDGIERVRSTLESAATDVPTGCPVAFSGGVDSGTVAAMTDGPLYVVGFQESHDLEAARTGADAMGREVRVVVLTHDRLRETVPRVARATGLTNAMDVSIAVPLFVAAERAADDGHDRLAVGQGADELFGGYDKVAGAPDDPRVEAETIRGATREVVGELPAQLARDVPALRAAGVEPVAPFLRDEVALAALSLPEEALVSGNRRKVGLRRAARSFVPDEVAERDKKAVQYGSYVSRELDRLARQAGYKRRQDDHVSKYVQSLVEGE